MNHSELPFLVALGQIPLIGPKKARLLLSYCGSPSQVFNASKKSLLKIPNIGINNIQSIKKTSPETIWEPVARFLEKYPSIKIISFLDDDYPSRLKVYEDAPLFLFYRGEAKLNPKKTISIVGTRKPSALGKSYCKDLVTSLKDHDVEVISGLAYGIDTEVHRLCVEHDVSTIGVLGHGLDQIYPSSNVSLAKNMVDGKGGVLTEFMPGILPKREHFPMRNRIIAAMSDAVVIVESKEVGGSMITAYFGNDYYKDVFAIPGRPSDTNAKGCNLLIKKHLASMIESGADLIQQMGWGDINTSSQKQLFIDLNEDEQKVVDSIRQNEQYNVDQIQSSLALKSSDLSAILLNLEFNGIIKAVPGKRYILV